MAVTGMYIHFVGAGLENDPRKDMFGLAGIATFGLLGGVGVFRLILDFNGVRADRLLVQHRHVRAKMIERGEVQRLLVAERGVEAGRVDAHGFGQVADRGPCCNLAGTGVIWAAVYMLWMLQRVVFGTRTSEENAKLHDLNLREALLILPLIFLMFFMGVYPQPFFNRSRDSVEAARQRVASPQEASPTVARKR